MRGMILDFNEASGEGVASSGDGERFRFSRQDWKAAAAPVGGLSIDFSTEEGRATDIYPVPDGGTSGAGVVLKSAGAQRAFKLGATALGCSIVGALIPLLGVVLSFIAFVAGLKGFRLGRQHNDNPAWIMALVGLFISGITIFYTLIALFFVLFGSGIGIGILSIMSPY